MEFEVEKMLDVLLRNDPVCQSALCIFHILCSTSTLGNLQQVNTSFIFEHHCSYKQTKNLGCVLSSEEEMLTTRNAWEIQLQWLTMLHAFNVLWILFPVILQLCLSLLYLTWYRLVSPVLHSTYQPKLLTAKRLQGQSSLIATTKFNLRLRVSTLSQFAVWNFVLLCTSRMIPLLVSILL